MADVIHTKLTAEGLARDESARIAEVEHGTGTPEPASAENLELLPEQISEVKGEIVAAPVEAPAEPAPQQDLGAVLETHSAQNVVNPESKIELSQDAKNLSDFLSGKIAAGDLQVTIKPGSESPESQDLPKAA